MTNNSFLPSNISEAETRKYNSSSSSFSFPTRTTKSPSSPSFFSPPGNVKFDNKLTVNSYKCIMIKKFSEETTFMIVFLIMLFLVFFCDFVFREFF